VSGLDIPEADGGGKEGGQSDPHTHYRTGCPYRSLLPLSHPHLGHPSPSSFPPSLTYIVERDARRRIEGWLDGQDHLLGGDRRGQEGHKKRVGMHDSCNSC